MSRPGLTEYVTDGKIGRTRTPLFTLDLHFFVIKVMKQKVGPVQKLNQTVEYTTVENGNFRFYPKEKE